MSKKVGVHRIGISSPDDVSGLKSAIESGDINPSSIIAILGKTEGNGCVNDFTRGFCTASYSLYLSSLLNLSVKETQEKIIFIMSGGTEGMLSPHVTVFTSFPSSSNERHPTNKRLIVAVGRTKDIKPWDLGRIGQVQEVAKAVKELIASEQLTPSDVHFVQIKVPLLTSSVIAKTNASGQCTCCTDTYESMGYSRGAAALGVAVALGEVDIQKIHNETICSDYSLYSNVASTSAGIELQCCEILVFGNSHLGTGNFIIDHTVMNDIIDGQSVMHLLKRMGIITADGESTTESRSKFINIFAKAGASKYGHVRGARHTMLNDSDINSTRHARAVVGGILASLVHDTMIYVSGGTEHQGPHGGGPVAVIAKVD